MHRNIKSADEAIDALGGPRTVGELLDGVDERVVWNWRKRGFPPHRYPAISKLLRRRRLRFSMEDVFPRMGNGGTKP